MGELPMWSVLLEPISECLILEGSILSSCNMSTFLRCSSKEHPAVRLMNLISAVASLCSSSFLIVHASLPVHRNDFFIEFQELQGDGFPEKLIFNDKAAFHTSGKSAVVTLAELRLWIIWAIDRIDGAMLRRVWEQFQHSIDRCLVIRCNDDEHL
ncbi:hypothetical protein ANN_22086 [Periplaneta americana]|uniref:Uncharacterized protein n=1 Tax=Periplaneta americana TaxID=6978 RepID=A0ABQ8S750_PERAM|nr:hypothetical protein ANN_22086 [Periplaneta americana]